MSDWKELPGGLKVRRLETDSPHVVEIFEVPMTLAEVEKRHIHKALLFTNWQIRRTARLLDIGASTLYRKMKEYNLGRPTCSPGSSTESSAP